VERNNKNGRRASELEPLYEPDGLYSALQLGQQRHNRARKGRHLAALNELQCESKVA